MRVALIGAGRVGCEVARWLLASGDCEVILFDQDEGRAIRSAQDLACASALSGGSTQIDGTSRPSDTAGSDVVALTLGAARTPDMNREDYIAVYARGVARLIPELVAGSPSALLVNFSNPVDLLTYLAVSVSGLPRSRVFGCAAHRDSAVLRYLISRAAGVAPRDVSALAIGRHSNEDTLALCGHATVGGLAVDAILPRERFEAIQQALLADANQIIALTRQGPFSAGSWTIADAISALRSPWPRLLPLSVMLRGEFGIDGVCIGVPARVNHEGVLDVVQVELAPKEAEVLRRGARVLKQQIETLLKPVLEGAVA